MSLAGYIGCNIEIPLSDTDSNDLIIIGNCFSSKYERQNVKKYQFTTPYVYEVSSDWGIEISKSTNTSTSIESKKKLIRLCEIMDSYLEKGDFFEHYTCWIGEESDERSSNLILQLNEFDIDQIEMPEKTLVRFEK